MDQKLQALKEAAKAASLTAYAPYSKFPVGAALSLEGSHLAGDPILGCNVENISFSMTVCAERNALAHAITRKIKPKTLKVLGIYMPGNILYSPCGACRQFIAELMSPDASIYAFSDGDEFKVWSIPQLLPDGFNSDFVAEG